MRFLSPMVLTVVLFSALSSAPALAQGAASAAPWGWLQLDTDLAERILAGGEVSAAGQLALDTHHALTAAVDDVASTRGVAYVEGLHEELSAVLVASGFHVPAVPLQGPDGLALAAPGVAAP